MKKGTIVTLSIIAFLVVLAGILFGAVFCLRSQTVTIVGDGTVAVSREDIIKTAGLKNGQSIFMLDKEKAINQIEAEYPYVKVIQIKTMSVTKIDIRIRARQPMMYAQVGENYYILDEELKVLNIFSVTEQQSSQIDINKLIKLTNVKIDSSTMLCDFVGEEYQQIAGDNFYNAMTNTFKKDVGEGVDVYFNRADVCEMIKEIEFQEFKTFNKMILTTKYGVKLDIENPAQDLTNKINICYLTIQTFLNSENVDVQSKVNSGTIKIYFDLDDNMKCVYVPNQQEG